MLDLLLQYVLDLTRALLVDELSGRVRKRMRRWAARRGVRHSGVAWGAHLRNRDRLLNRLLTELEGDL